MHDNPSYKVPRKDLLQQLHLPVHVLDVGCNDGSVARALNLLYPNVKIWGLEINQDALANALPLLENGWSLDLDRIDKLEAVLGTLSFDHILAGDVLEHTFDYQKITGVLYDHLETGGRLIISVPNYGHWHTLWVFLARKWPRNERGIFDKTHRTVIMHRNLKEFLRDCPGGQFKLLKRNYRFFETNRYWKLNMAITYALFPLLLIPYVKDFVTMGYVFSITKPRA